MLTFVQKSSKQIEVAWTGAQNNSGEDVDREIVGQVLTLKKAHWPGGVGEMPLDCFEMELDVLPRFKITGRGWT